MTSPQPCEWCY